MFSVGVRLWFSVEEVVFLESFRLVKWIWHLLDEDAEKGKERMAELNRLLDDGLMTNLVDV